MNMRLLFVTLCALVMGLVPVRADIQTKQAIRITVSGVPLDEKGRIDGDYPVADNGTINMPYIGQVHAAGMTAQGLALSLQSHYKSAGIYRNPTFQVFTDTANTKVAEQVVTVGGQVRRTGPVPYTQDLTLWGAVQAAGGPTEFGAMKRVRLTRGKNVKEYNLTIPRFMQIPLEVNDSIEVPQKKPFES